MGFKQPRLGRKTTPSQAYINTNTSKPGSYWTLDNASADVDYVNSRAYGFNKLDDVQTVVRASDAYLKYSNGWAKKPPNILRVNNDGALIEEQRTNMHVNSAFIGTNLDTQTVFGAYIFQQTGLSRQVLKYEVIDGMNVVRWRFYGTPVGNGDILIRFGSDGTPASGSGAQVFMGSVFLRKIDGSLNGISNVTMNVEEYTSGNSYVGGIGPATPDLSTSGWKRAKAKYTSVGSVGNYIRHFVRFNVLNTIPVDITIDVAWPMVEILPNTNSSESSPLPTIGSAVVRAADTLTLVNPVARVFDITKGGLFVDCYDLIGISGVVRQILRARIDGNNNLQLFVNTDGKVFFQVTTGGVLVCNMQTPNAVVAGTRYKMFISWEANKFVFRCSASLGTIANTVTGSPPVGTPVVGIGQNAQGVQHFNSLLRRMTFFLNPPTEAYMDRMVL